MKKLLILAILALLSSCDVERRVVSKSIKHETELQAIAQKVFNQYSGKRQSGFIKNDSLALTDKERTLVYKKLKFEEIETLYEPDYDYYVQADSIVIFSRGGLWTRGHDIIIDLHKKPVGALSAMFPPFVSKVTDRMYYIGHNATPPLY